MNGEQFADLAVKHKIYRAHPSHIPYLMIERRVELLPEPMMQNGVMKDRQIVEREYCDRCGVSPRDPAISDPCKGAKP